MEEIMNYERIDARIKQIWDKMDKLPESLEFSCGKWPPKWEAPFSEEQIVGWEEKHHVRLPEDYRRFITTKAAGGTQPFYGLCNLLKVDSDKEYSTMSVEKPFAFTLDKPLIIFNMTEEEQEEYFNDENEDEDEDELGGYIPLCTEGCGMDSILVINSADSDTYGTVWFYDLANDCGIIPLRHPDTKTPFSFLDWLEYWVDFTISHSPSDYFSYGELTEPFQE